MRLAVTHSFPGFSFVVRSEDSTVFMLHDSIDHIRITETDIEPNTSVLTPGKSVVNFLPCPAPICRFKNGAPFSPAAKMIRFSSKIPHSRIQNLII